MKSAKRNLSYYIFYTLLFLTVAVFSQTVFGHGMSEAEKQSIIDGGNWAYLWLGITHMLSGYDHLAFVFGIIFFLQSFKDIAKYVTAFTIGHSVTLIYATFNAIQINYFAIDAVIGLSVCYIAFSNIDGFKKYLNINPPNMMIMIVGLGLIHGFGLSTRLQQLPLSTDNLLMNIISFNVGIELGQISALAIMLLVITAWRKSHFFQTFSLIVNYSLILLGGLLFLMQMHGYEHSVYPEEFSSAVMVEEGDNKQVDIPAFNDNSWEETIKVVLPARAEIEYKLLVKENDTFSYYWKTQSDELYFDFHGEPKTDSTSFKSYKKGTATESSGILNAPFTGTHGWYWKNNTNTDINILIKVKGEYKRLDTDDRENKTSTKNTNHDSID